jgi:hypothetical protein
MMSNHWFGGRRGPKEQQGAARLFVAVSPFADDLGRAQTLPLKACP